MRALPVAANPHNLRERQSLLAELAQSLDRFDRVTAKVMQTAQEAVDAIDKGKGPECIKSPSQPPRWRHFWQP